MKTPSSPVCCCIRIRSPRTAPPENGLDGSIATTPTLFPSLRAWVIIRSTSVDFPAPGGPVTPITTAFPQFSSTLAINGINPLRPSTCEIRRASANRSPESIFSRRGNDTAVFYQDPPQRQGRFRPSKRRVSRWGDSPWGEPTPNSGQPRLTTNGIPCLSC